MTTLMQIIKAAGASVVGAEARQRTGVLTVGLDLREGRAKTASIEFREQYILRREACEKQSIGRMLEECYTAAQRENCQFFGRIEVEYYFFDGVAVDIRNSVKQTFACSG